jgi:hypothetical protein
MGALVHVILGIRAIGRPNGGPGLPGSHGPGRQCCGNKVKTILTPTNGFAVPASCQCSPQPIADAGTDRTVCQGQSTTIGTPAQAGHSYSWSPGGQSTAQVSVAPAADTTYTVTATTACGSAQDSVTVFVDDGSGGGLSDDFESGAAGWGATGLWHLATSSG